MLVHVYYKGNRLLPLTDIAKSAVKWADKKRECFSYAMVNRLQRAGVQFIVVNVLDESKGVTK